MGRPSDFWTPERNEILREHYPTTTAAEICQRFGWDVEPIVVNRRASFLKIPKKVEVEPCGTTVKQGKGYRIVTHRVMG